MPPRKLQLEPSQEPFSSGFLLPPAAPPPGSSGVNAGLLAGVCAALAVVLVLVAVVAWFAWFRTRSKASKASKKHQEVWSPTQVDRCDRACVCMQTLNRSIEQEKLPVESKLVS
jgi:hypothetical protein